jgi:hypothetical protein
VDDFAAFFMTIWAVKALDPSLRGRSMIEPIFVVPILLLADQSPVSVGPRNRAGTTREKKYDIVVPRTVKWGKMSPKWYDIGSG